MRCDAAVSWVILTSLVLLGCGSDSTSTANGSGGGSNGSGGSNSEGDSCDKPLVLTDRYLGTNNFTEPFAWGDGSIEPDCDGGASRPASFIRWTADTTEPMNFKVFVSGSESVTLEVFAGDSCDDKPLACTHDKLPIGAAHVAGAYVPIEKGQDITAVVVSRDSSAPSGTWTISMGD